MLERVWRKGNPLTLLVGMQTSTATMENSVAAAAAAKLLQSCPTLCNPIDGSPPGSPVPGILQERILEWVAISFSNAWKWKVKVKSLSSVWLLATSWTAAYQASPSMGVSRQEYWSGVPLPSPRVLAVEAISHCLRERTLFNTSYCFLSLVLEAIERFWVSRKTCSQRY